MTDSYTVESSIYTHIFHLRGPFDAEDPRPWYVQIVKDHHQVIMHWDKSSGDSVTESTMYLVEGESIPEEFRPSLDVEALVPVANGPTTGGRIFVSVGGGVTIYADAENHPFAANEHVGISNGSICWTK